MPHQGRQACKPCCAAQRTQQASWQPDPSHAATCRAAGAWRRLPTAMALAQVGLGVVAGAEAVHQHKAHLGACGERADRETCWSNNRAGGGAHKIDGLLSVSAGCSGVARRSGGLQEAAAAAAGKKQARSSSRQAAQAASSASPNFCRVCLTCSAIRSRNVLPFLTCKG